MTVVNSGSGQGFAKNKKKQLLKNELKFHPKSMKRKYKNYSYFISALQSTKLQITYQPNKLKGGWWIMYVG